MDVSIFETVCAASDQARWLEARREGIGATDASVVLGANPWKSSLELYGEKIGAIEPADLKDVERVQWGFRLEPIVLEAYAERSGRKAQHDNAMLRSTLAAWPAQCTLDGTTWLDDASYSKRWPLEIKTTSAFHQDDWADGPPEMYRIQVHHQMLVTGADKATLACLIGGQQLVWCDIERDEALITRINHECDRFWQRILHHEPPPADETDASKRALNVLYPQSDAEQVLELDAQIQDVLDHLEVIKMEIKQAEADKQEIENMLKSKLGTAEKGVLPTGWAVSWKTQKRAGYTVEPGEYRVLRIHRPKKGKR